MKGVAIPYNAAELDWIEAHKTGLRPETHRAFCKKFHRLDVSLTNYNCLCKRNGWLTGRTGNFVKGCVPPNKGKKMSFNAKSAATQFKKGHRSKNTKYLGHERMNVDGYVEISVAETNPHTGFERRYVFKHRHLWEQINGPVPDGMVLKSLDGNKSNADPANWVAIPRAMLPGLNGIYGRDYDAAPDELKPTIMAITKLEHVAREAMKTSENRNGELI